jgi:hypothetical protein
MYERKGTNSWLFAIILIFFSEKFPLLVLIILNVNIKQPI